MSNNTFGDIFEDLGRVWDSGLEKVLEWVTFEEEIKDLRRNGLGNRNPVRSTPDDFYTGTTPDFTMQGGMGGLSLRGGTGQVLMIAGVALAAYMLVKD